MIQHDKAEFHVLSENLALSSTKHVHDGSDLMMLNHTKFNFFHEYNNYWYDNYVWFACAYMIGFLIKFYELCALHNTQTVMFG